MRRLAVCFATLALLAGCGPAETERPAASGTTPLRVAALTVPDTPWYDTWRRFEERLSQENHDLAPEFFLTGQLGSEETVLSGLRRNRIQMGGFSLHGLATVVPELSLLLAPYLFESQAHADFVIDGYLTEVYAELLAERGIELLAWSEVGWNHVYATRPIVGPASLRGQAMRASNAEAPRRFAEALGARSINVTFAELHTALQTGMVVSGQSGIGMYVMTGLGREAPHLHLTGHVYDTGITVANRSWWLGLSDETREAIRRSLGSQAEGREAIREHLLRLEEEALADPRLTVTQPTEEVLAEWRALGLATHPALIERSGPRAAEIYPLIEQANAAWAE